MRLNRRDLFKLGAASAAGLIQVGTSACSSRSDPGAGSAASTASIAILLRGLSLIEYQQAKKTIAVHLLDATKFGMPAHEARLRVALSALDQAATTLPPDRKEQAGTSREEWIWLLKNKTVSVMEDSDPPDANHESSMPSGEEPSSDDWKSLKWIPNIRDLTGAPSVDPAADNFVCTIGLKHGLVQGAKPKGRTATVAKWTFKKPGAGGAIITKQKFSDTALFSRKLNGHTPVITIDSGSVVLRSGGTGEAAFENAAPPPTTPPGTAITIGHFPLFFKVVTSVFEPEWSVEPTDLPGCTGCETDPIFCPPAWGSF
jgi:hypothetical protein